MQQQLTQSQVMLVAGGGLYDHLPAPRQSPSLPSQSTEEKRQTLGMMGFGLRQEVMVGYPPY